MEALKITKTQALGLAEKLRERNGFIDVVKLANEMGIDVYATSGDPEFNAEISYSNNEFSILVNEDHVETRRRFSIAHEIGHYVLDRKLLLEHGTLDRANDYKDDEEKNREKDADSLAAEILMPAMSVEQLLQTKNLSKQSRFDGSILGDIADCFRVSRPMVITRLRNLGYSIPYIEFA
jgi:Zn-dependent peptidase ImmA (M78 family)